MIARRHGLLGEGDVCHRADAADRVHGDIGRRPAAVGIDAELDLSPMASRTARTRATSLSGSMPNLDLHRRKAASDRSAGDVRAFSGSRLKPTTWWGRIRAPCRQAAQRPACQRLAQQIPQRHLDAGLREMVARHGKFVFVREALDVGDFAERLAHQQWREIGIDEVRRGDLIFTAPPRRARDFAQADEPPSVCTFTIRNGDTECDPPRPLLMASSGLIGTRTGTVSRRVIFMSEGSEFIDGADGICDDRGETKCGRAETQCRFVRPTGTGKNGRVHAPVEASQPASVPRSPARNKKSRST